MPTLYAIKPAFQTLLRPVVRQLAGLGVTANQVTVLAAVISIAAGLLVASNPAKPLLFLVFPVVLFLRMAMNAVDGMLAREHGQASKLGMYLNELCDVVSDVALILPFFIVPGFGLWSVLPFAFAALLVEYAGVLGTAAGIGRNYAGPLGKSDRALALGLLAVIAASGPWEPGWMRWAFPILTLLSLVTLANRVRLGLKSVPTGQPNDGSRGSARNAE